MNLFDEEDWREYVEDDGDLSAEDVAYLVGLPFNVVKDAFDDAFGRHVGWEYLGQGVADSKCDAVYALLEQRVKEEFVPEYMVYVTKEGGGLEQIWRGTAKDFATAEPLKP